MSAGPIIFSNDPGVGSGRLVLFAMAVDGSGLTQITTVENDSWVDYPAAISPDGTLIAFPRFSNVDSSIITEGADTAGLYTVHPDGSALTRILAQASLAYYSIVAAVFSPDSSKIALVFTTSATPTTVIKKMNVDGTGSVDITIPGASAAEDPAPSDFFPPVWTNNDEIVFTNGLGSGGIGRIKADGTGYTLLTDGSSFSDGVYDYYNDGGLLIGRWNPGFTTLSVGRLEHDGSSFTALYTTSSPPWPYQVFFGATDSSQALVNWFDSGTMQMGIANSSDLTNVAFPIGPSLSTAAQGASWPDLGGGAAGPPPPPPPPFYGPGGSVRRTMRISGVALG